MDFQALLQIILAAIATLCAITLLVLRFWDRSEDMEQRLLFADLLIFVAAIEMLADGLSDAGADGVFTLIATAGRGAMLVGILALLISYRR